MNLCDIPGQPDPNRAPIYTSIPNLSRWFFEVNQGDMGINHTPIARLFQSSGRPNTTRSMSPKYSRHCSPAYMLYILKLRGSSSTRSVRKVFVWSCIVTCSNIARSDAPMKAFIMNMIGMAYFLFSPAKPKNCATIGKVMNFESGRSETDAARVDWADTHYWGCIKWSVELTGAPATHGAPAPFCSCTAGTSVVPSCILIVPISLGDCHRLWWRLMVPLRRVLEGAPILDLTGCHALLSWATTPPGTELVSHDIRQGSHIIAPPAACDSPNPSVCGSGYLVVLLLIPSP